MTLKSGDDEEDVQVNLSNIFSINQNNYNHLYYYDVIYRNNEDADHPQVRTNFNGAVPVNRDIGGQTATWSFFYRPVSYAVNAINSSCIFDNRKLSADNHLVDMSTDSSFNNARLSNGEVCISGFTNVNLGDKIQILEIIPLFEKADGTRFKKKMKYISSKDAWLPIERIENSNAALETAAKLIGMKIVYAYVDDPIWPELPLPEIVASQYLYGEDESGNGIGKEGYYYPMPGVRYNGREVYKLEEAPVSCFVMYDALSSCWNIYENNSDENIFNVIFDGDAISSVGSWMLTNNVSVNRNKENLAGYYYTNTDGIGSALAMYDDSGEY